MIPVPDNDDLPASLTPNPRVRIGDNKPPSDLTTSSEGIAAKEADEVDPDLDVLLAEVEDARKAAREVYAKLTPEAPRVLVDKAQNIRDRLKQLSKQIDQLRIDRKAPYLRAEREIDNYFRAAIMLPLQIEEHLAPRVTQWLKTDRDRRQREADEEAQRIAAENRQIADLEAAARDAEPVPFTVPTAKVGGLVAHRRTGLRTRITAKVENQDTFYEAVREYPEVIEFFQQLANKLVRTQVPPGCKKVENEVS